MYVRGKRLRARVKINGAPIRAHEAGRLNTRKSCSSWSPAYDVPMRGGVMVLAAHFVRVAARFGQAMTFLPRLKVSGILTF
jgi:hypothetical protein